METAYNIICIIYLCDLNATGWKDASPASLPFDICHIFELWKSIFLIWSRTIAVQLDHQASISKSSSFYVYSALVRVDPWYLSLWEFGTQVRSVSSLESMWPLSLQNKEIWLNSSALRPRLTTNCWATGSSRYLLTFTEIFFSWISSRKCVKQDREHINRNQSCRTLFWPWCAIETGPNCNYISTYARVNSSSYNPCLIVLIGWKRPSVWTITL